MAAIESVWIARRGNGGRIRVVRSEELAGQYRESAGWQVEGPFVLEGNLRGAVEALRELADLIDALRGPHADPLAILDADVTEALLRARVVIGGR